MMYCMDMHFYALHIRFIPLYSTILKRVDCIQQKHNHIKRKALTNIMVHIT